MCVRIARHKGIEPVIGIDIVPERLELARRYGADTIDATKLDPVEEIRQRTDGRGADAVIDAVGMEAHGSRLAELMHKSTAVLPDAAARVLMEKAGIDRLEVLMNAIASVRRGGTLSISGVYGGALDPLPMMELFDKQIQIRMGQANVRRWVDDILPLLMDGDPLGSEDFATHRLPLEEGPRAYEMFQKKQDGAIKVVLEP
jgi:threonine dehydrogenase-like Zn-dependent dehydrogenase